VGTGLKQQAVLFRASHHSGPLEVGHHSDLISDTVEADLRPRVRTTAIPVQARPPESGFFRVRHWRATWDSFARTKGSGSIWKA
jgi:hypothetical protein